MIYLDHAATSYPKPEKVYEEMNRCMREYCANPGRGGHTLSLASSRAVLDTREKLAQFFHIRNSLQIAFTKNATEALNIALQGSLAAGDHVITTHMEHNSVIRPLKTLEKERGIQLTLLRGNSYGEIDPDDILKAIQPNSKLIAMTLSSNVNGIIMPFKETGRIAREHGVTFLLDASQGAGSIPIDVEEANIGLLAFPGHKGLLGPQGIGGLYVREGLEIECLCQGGTGSNSEEVYQPRIMPDLLESGTLNTPGIVGLGAGIDFIGSFGIENMKIYKYGLVKRLQEGMAELKGIRLYSRNGIDQNSGIVAMNFDGIDSTEVSYVLDKAYGIATRAGLHCAPLAHETLGTLRTGIVRFSIGCFNTLDEVDQTLDALREIAAHI